jgi:hypothetical protein
VIYFQTPGHILYILNASERMILQHAEDEVDFKRRQYGVK